MIRVRGPHVLVKRLEEPRPQSSTIIIPDSVADRPSPYALVLGVGPAPEIGLEMGDVVILSAYAGAPVNVEIEGEMIEALIVPEAAILAVVEDK